MWWALCVDLSSEKILNSPRSSELLKELASNQRSYQKPSSEEDSFYLLMRTLQGATGEQNKLELIKDMDKLDSRAKAVLGNSKLMMAFGEIYKFPYIWGPRLVSIAPLYKIRNIGCAVSDLISFVVHHILKEIVAGQHAVLYGCHPSSSMSSS